MMRRVLIFLLLPFLLFARGKVIYKQPNPETLPAWLTGPLLAPSANVVPIGYCNIEPYIFATAFTGLYTPDWEVEKSPTFWSNILQIPIQIGLTSWLDFQFSPTVSWNYTQHQSTWTLGDLPIGIDIQLYRSKSQSWIPNVKLALKENVPIGKYRNLDPKKLATDAGGVGSWITSLGVVFGHIYHIADPYYVNYRLYLSYLLPAPVHLTGFNFYGGGYGTDVRMFPPENFQADLGIEITLAQTWAFALDILGIWGGKRHFTGKVGTDAFGNPAFLSLGSLVEYSIAPAIEYNWNTDFGIIAGAWFTVAGRNSFVFTSGVFAANYYF